MDRGERHRASVHSGAADMQPRGLRRAEEALGRAEGGRPCAEHALGTWDEEEEEKAERLCFHSEKLAIAFRLVHTPPGTPLLLLSKNLRVCPDCHEATKLIAKLRGRKIVMRDANRFHHFHTDGSCVEKRYRVHCGQGQ